MTSPLTSAALFHLGPVPITEAVVVTWAIMAVLVAGGILVARRLSLVPSTTPGRLRADCRHRGQPNPRYDAGRACPLSRLHWHVVCLHLCRQLVALVPGVEPPTAHLETDAALALLVFLAVIWFGIRAGGVSGYLATFASPSPIMIPLNFIESLTRTFSLLVRLFGNVMSGVFVIGIVLSLAGLLVPIPLMALDLLTGAVQAYIFAILAMVFIAGAVSERQPASDISSQRTPP